MHSSVLHLLLACLSSSSLNSNMECIKTTPAPTAPSILTYGDMEGPSNSIIAQWPSRCTRTLISRKDNPSNDHLVQQGFQSLKVNGSKQCFLFRPIGSPCGVGRVKDPIVAGDVIRISLWVRVAEPNVVSFIAGGRTLLFNSTLTCLRKQKAFSLNRTKPYWYLTISLSLTLYSQHRCFKCPHLTITSIKADVDGAFPRMTHTWSPAL